MKYFNRLVGLILFFVLSIGISSCEKNGNDSRYELISGRWLEREKLVDGVNQGSTGRQHIFYSNTEYVLICAPNELCAQLPPGEWSLISENTLQVVYGSVINIYTINKLDAGNIWLEYRENAKPVIIKLTKN